jgi:hypothetical protein
MGGDQENGNRVLAHIAYEISWRLQLDPRPTNAELIRTVGWLLILLGTDALSMSPERQKGLIGECMFLRMLLLRAQELGVASLNALGAWTGYDNAKRDFYAPGVAVEAKATASVTRLHEISSMDQLAPQEPGEAVYLFSVGIRQDRTAPRKVTNYVADVEALLVNPQGVRDDIAVEHFRRQLLAYGFDWAQQDIYERLDGFLSPHLYPALFREPELRRLSLNDFVGKKIPETVRSIGYSLEVVAPTMNVVEINQVLDKLLRVGQ